MADSKKSSRRTSRARLVAGGVLIVLILMLFGLGVVLVNVMRPPGAPKVGSLSSGMTWVRSIYGFGPRPDQQLFQPIGVAVDAQGRIYVSEPQRSRIVVFTRDGGFDGIIKLMQSRDVGMVRPAGMDVDDAGNLYVADRDLHRIIVFDRNRKFVRNIMDDLVTGVKVEGDRVYGLGRDHVSVYSLDGRLITRFGSQGKGPGQFDQAYSLAVGPDGLLYVVESFNKRISVFKPDGQFVRTMGRTATTSATPSAASSAGPAASQPAFDLPTGLVIDANGRLVTLDAFLFQLTVMNTGGKVLGTYGQMGSADGQFVYPSGLAYDRNGDVFVVTDTMNNRVEVLRLAGSGSARLDRRLPSALLQPVCYGPLALLLLAIALVVVSARRRREQQEETGAESDDV